MTKRFSTKKFAITPVMKRLVVATRHFPLPLSEAVERDAPSKEAAGFRVLVATMLSARTKDSTTFALMPRLFRVAPDAQKMAQLSVRQIEKLIYPVGFYHTKARNLKALASILESQYGGRVPRDEEELEALPGVGRKTANIVRNILFRAETIGVDVHVHRISNRFGFVRTKTPKQTEAALYKKLPRAYWRHYNRVLVLHGQNVCTPVAPKCTQCPVNQWCQRKSVTAYR